jgi:hypothetical protein
MPDYAPNFTARIRVRYTAFGRQHSQTWRVPTAGALDANIGLGVVDIGNYYADIQGELVSDFAILSTSFARENEDIFLPSAVEVTVAPAGGDAVANRIKRDGATSWSWVGRTSGGLRAIIYQYGFIGFPLSEETDAKTDDFRLYGTESTFITDVTGDLNGFLDTLCGNDGLPITFYPYANLKYNDYWMRKSRQGA